MSFSLYDASVPAFLRQLKGLQIILNKAASFAEAKKFDPSVLLNMRLAPDMYPFVRQVQLATDHANGVAARLTNVPVPKNPDVETSIPELEARVAKTIDFLKSIMPEHCVGSETRDIVLLLGPKKDFRLELKGDTYVINFALPNFYFHATAAYLIARHAGVELGKRDYLGGAI